MLTRNLNIFLILLISFFLRIYRLPELLGFWYDQGRDALVIWELIEKGKLFLIGPMMGFTGMFRGPWYYYLITPFYYLGKGDPIYPTVFLALLSVFAIFVLYKVGKEIGGERLGLLSAFLAGVSTYVIGASRWLSNPTPTLLIGISLVWAIFKFLEKKKWSVPLIAFLIGMGLNFGAATEIYYIPAVLIIFFINRKILPNWKVFLFSFLIFVSCFFPQIIFELRHPGVLSGALYNFVFQEKTFTYDFIGTLVNRLSVYYNLFYSKFFTDGASVFLPFFIVFVTTVIIKWKKIVRDAKVLSLFIIFIAPFIGTLFFISNLGGFYDYYFTGYYLIFILFFAYILSYLFENKIGRVFILIFLLIFIYKNHQNYKNNYFVSLDSPEIIAYSNQLKAIDWIYKDSSDLNFNVDVYVPPVMPYAYDYLFLWQENVRNDYRLDKEKQIDILYTLYEVDVPHPERLEAWIARQDGIGEVLKVERFGGIIVERRDRIKYD